MKLNRRSALTIAIVGLIASNDRSVLAQNKAEQDSGADPKILASFIDELESSISPGKADVWSTKLSTARNFTLSTDRCSPGFAERKGGA